MRKSLKRWSEEGLPEHKMGACVKWLQNLQSITFNIRVIRRCIENTKIHFPVCWRWGVGWTSHPRIRAWCRVHFSCVLLFFLRRLLLFLLEVFETFELHRVFDFLGTMEQDENVPPKFGAHSKVDNGIVEAGRLCKQTGKDAGKVGHRVTIGRPYRDDSIRWPCNNEGCANDNRNLKDKRRIVLNLLWKTTSGKQYTGNSSLGTWLEGEHSDCPEGMSHRRIQASKRFALMEPSRPRSYILNFGMVVCLSNALSSGMKIATVPYMFIWNQKVLGRLKSTIGKLKAPL